MSSPLFRARMRKFAKRRLLLETLERRLCMTAPFPLNDTFFLNSNPGADHTVYLDFDGHVTSGTIWNTNFNNGADFTTPAYDTDGNASVFSNTELENIQWIYKRVVEDFLPFDVNITTQDPGAAALTKSGNGDTQWGVRVVIGGSSQDWYGASAGGVAYLGSFNSNADTPVYAFENNLGNGHEKYTAEAVSHEVGHSLGLYHDGRTLPGNVHEEYYEGHGSFYEDAWAPIMGVGYYRNLTQWSQGEYQYANNQEDDLAIITTANGFGYRADDIGDTQQTAGTLDVDVSGIIHTGTGFIGSRTDVDVFELNVGSGYTLVDIRPAERGPNLDIQFDIYDDQGQLVLSQNDANYLSAFAFTPLNPGTYYLHVSGAGKGSPLVDGYTDYGSLGEYNIYIQAPPSNYDVVAIGAVDASKSEGNAGSTAFTFVLQRAGDISGATTVDYAVSGIGANPVSATDFVGGVLPQGTVSFAANETQKTVTINVAGDLIPEFDETFEVTLSNPAGATEIWTAVAPGTILDDDTVGIAVTPINGLTTSESGGAAQFDVVLTAAPTADVTINVATSDATEGSTSTTQLVFTTANWQTPQTVTVTGVDDAGADGDTSYQVLLGAAVSSDLRYQGIDPADVSLVNLDNDAVGVSVSPTSGLETSEAGATDQFTVVLQSEPTANVTISITSLDSTEGTTSVSQLVFTPANWSTPQTVVVTGVDDTKKDGDVLYTVQVGAAQSADLDYQGIDANDVQVTNVDDDRRGGGGGGGGGGGNGHGRGGNNAAPVDLDHADGHDAGGENSLHATPAPWLGVDAIASEADLYHASPNNPGPGLFSFSTSAPVVRGLTASRMDLASPLNDEPDHAGFVDTNGLDTRPTLDAYAALQSLLAEDTSENASLAESTRPATPTPSDMRRQWESEVESLFAALELEDDAFAL
ncbi:MAG: hypothetical protein KDB14_08940 [Planctomycetales bacterium]|nr:hypothetical protein [Planctomycetales bacterium]